MVVILLKVIKRHGAELLYETKQSTVASETNCYIRLK